MIDKHDGKVPRSEAYNAYQLLDEICEVILAEPMRYNQESWLDRSRQQPTCGTVACVAGWVVALREPRGFLNSLYEADRNSAIPSTASFILGMERYETGKLFDGNALDDLISDEGVRQHSCQSPEYAEAGVTHIRSFMARHEIQLKATVLPPYGFLQRKAMHNLLHEIEHGALADVPEDDE